MKELTALEQTIWNLAMTGGSVLWNYGKISIIDAFAENNDNDRISIKVACVVCERGLAKPILHSLNKITETVLEGGKVPIVELLEMKYEDYFYKNYNNKEKTKYCLESNEEYAKSFFESSNDKKIELYFSVIEHEPFWLVDQLRQWGFNIENLNPDEFIEKSTLKTE